MIAEIRQKIALIQRVEAEYGFGVVIEEGLPLSPIPGLPAGVIEVFGILRRLRGNSFWFRQPDEIGSVSAWAGRPPQSQGDPLGEALAIGCAVRDIPADLLAEREVIGGNISLDVEEGYVYYIDGDDLAYYYHSDEVAVVDELAGDIVTFFNECVLGAGYPELVATVFGPGIVEHRIRRGRNKGEYSDTWRRLLIAAGLSS